MTSSAHLQREADIARVGLADTLGQLRDGVAPSALSAEAIALVKDSGLSIVKALAEQARANPVPALLIGAGLTMLLTRTTGGDVMGAAGSTLKSAASGAAAAASGAASAASTAASAASNAASAAAAAATGTVKDAAAGVADRVASAVGGAQAQASEGYGSVRDKVGDQIEAGRQELHDRQDQAAALAATARDKAQTMADQTRQTLTQLLEEQPILMAALGAALGAAVGAAVPLSKAEKDMIGTIGARAVGAGRDALATAAEVVKQEAQNADLGGKVGDLADKVVHGITKDIRNPL